MHKVIVLVAVGALVAFLAVAAGAQAASGRTCYRTNIEGVRFTVEATTANTSCAFARATYRAARNAPGSAMPKRLRVKSPVTGKTYTLRLTWKNVKRKAFGQYLYENRARKIGVEISAFAS
jgi:hypothetical protein